MYLNPTWNILTIGDGDLSFSRSLLEDHGHNNLIVSTLDDVATINSKYQSNEIEFLSIAGISIFHQLDISDSSSIPPKLANKFDLVIFQFPLIPEFKSRKDYQHLEGNSSNLLNRLLIVNFLNHCASYLLASEGANLCYITSKDVKPYSDWDLENIGPLESGLGFLGMMEFDLANFPQYRIRNVARDKEVKATEAFTYVWGRKNIVGLNTVLRKSTKHLIDHCRLCGKGPFGSSKELSLHENSKSHKRKAKYQAEWLNYRASVSDGKHKIDKQEINQ